MDTALQERTQPQVTPQLDSVTVLSRPDSVSAIPRQQTADAPLRQAVQLRAYELFLERGREHGHDVEDWLRAELELTYLPES